MSSNLHIQESGVTAQAGPPVSDGSAQRRRMLLGGGGAVLASLKTGSALAGGICISPSSFSSITASTKTSNAPRTYGSCKSHGFYGNNGQTDTTLDGRWSPVVRSTATLSNQGFPSNGRTNWTLNTKLDDIIKAGSTLWHEDANLIVIYLDFKTGRANGAITLTQVYDLWRALFLNGMGIAANSPIKNWTPTDVREFYAVWVSGTYPA